MAGDGAPAAAQLLCIPKAAVQGMPEAGMISRAGEMLTAGGSNSLPSGCSVLPSRLRTGPLQAGLFLISPQCAGVRAPSLFFIKMFKLRV